jgi:hypothetical protein
MSGIYHQIFVNSTYDTPEKISLLNRHMYTKAKPVIHSESTKPIESLSKSQPTVKTHSEIVYPDKKDTLFWCLYIAKNGIHEYTMISQGYSNIEIGEKQKIMEFHKVQPSRLKNTNVKVTNVAIQEIMSDIVTNTMLSVSTLIAMAVFYNIRIMLTKENKTYINICPIDEYAHTVILHKNAKGEYGIDTNVTDYKIKQIEEVQYCLHRYDKPLDSISNFSSDELKKLSARLGVDQASKYKKSELYQETTRRCLW